MKTIKSSIQQSGTVFGLKHATPIPPLDTEPTLVGPLQVMVMPPLVDVQVSLRVGKWLLLEQVMVHQSSPLNKDLNGPMSIRYPLRIHTIYELYQTLGVPMVITIQTAPLQQ